MPSTITFSISHPSGAPKTVTLHESRTHPCLWEQLTDPYVGMQQLPDNWPHNFHNPHTLTPAEIERTGLVNWSANELNKPKEPRQKDWIQLHYANQFNDAVNHIANLFGHPNYSHFGKLWDECTSERAKLIRYSNNVGDNETDRFSKKRSTHSSRLYTPVEGNYLTYFHRHLQSLIEHIDPSVSIKAQDHLGTFSVSTSKQLETDLMHIAKAAQTPHHWIVEHDPENHSPAVYGLLGHNNGQCLPLTIWVLAKPNADINSFQQIIHHTCHQQLQPIEQLVHQKLVDIASKREVAANEFLKDVSSVYWWLANACLNKRGSAACTEMFCRALCRASGFDWPLYKPGISLDLECMARSEPEFIQAVPQFWERPSLSLAGSERSA